MRSERVPQRRLRARAPSRHRYIDGPCKRQMRTNLHSFAMDWVRRARDFKPPGVPTTCFYITSVPTESTWRVTDFLGKGVVSSVLPGDGTVTAQSIQGPCELWQRPPALCGCPAICISRCLHRKVVALVSVLPSSRTHQRSPDSAE